MYKSIQQTTKEINKTHVKEVECFGVLEHLYPPFCHIDTLNVCNSRQKTYSCHRVYSSLSVSNKVRMKLHSNLTI